MCLFFKSLDLFFIIEWRRCFALLRSMIIKLDRLTMRMEKTKQSKSKLVNRKSQSAVNIWAIFFYYIILFLWKNRFGFLHNYVLWEIAVLSSKSNDQAGKIPRRKYQAKLSHYATSFRLRIQIWELSFFGNILFAFFCAIHHMIWSENYLGKCKHLI